MRFKITQEQELLRQTVSDFALAEVSPLASKIDWERKIPDGLLGKLPGLGLYGITIPVTLGGAGADFLSLVIAVEELSKASGSVGAEISFHNGVVCEALLLSSNSELKESLLPKLATGTIGAFSLDPKSTITCKIEEEDSIMVNGSSRYVMSAASAGIFLFAARTGDDGRAIICFSKDQLDSGFTVGGAEKLLGMRAADTARISFSSAKLPVESLVFGLENTEIAMEQLLARSRLAVAAQALGIAQASLDAEINYANERSQFNTKIGNFYAIRDYIATDEISIQTSRSVTYSAASDLDALQNQSSSSSSGRDSAMAKVSASNAAVQAARHSIRVHGGYGFIRDYPVERFLRDARLTQLYIESNEALKSLIAGSLLSV
ncbi:MAG: acyl-CoA dehydrogenase family protein [Nitrososphaerales archaeon]